MVGLGDYYSNLGFSGLEMGGTDSKFEEEEKMYQIKTSWLHCKVIGERSVLISVNELEFRGLGLMDCLESALEWNKYKKFIKSQFIANSSSNEKIIPMYIWNFIDDTMYLEFIKKIQVNNLLE